MALQKTNSLSIYLEENPNMKFRAGAIRPSHSLATGCLEGTEYGEYSMFTLDLLETLRKKGSSPF